MPGGCAGGSSQLAAQHKYLGYYRLPRSYKAYPGIWKLSEDEQIFVTGRQKDHVCTKCILWSLPLYSTISGSSAEQFSTCMAISMTSSHLPPSKGSVPPGDTSRASLTPVSWLSLCLAPPPSCQHPHKTEVRAARLSWHRRAGQYAGDCHSPNACGDKILVP